MKSLEDGRPRHRGGGCAPDRVPRLPITPSPRSSNASKCRDFSGTLTKVEWTNPHGFFHVDIKDPGRHRSQLVVSDLRADHAETRRDVAAAVQRTTSARTCG